MPKYKAHVPVEQYGFIEVESQNLDEVVDEYNRLKTVFEAKDGLNQLDWARVRNKYITTGEIDVEVFEQLSRFQRSIINEVKKTFKSLK